MGELLRRTRFPLLAGWAVAWGWASFNYAHSGPLNDWRFGRFAGRGLVGAEPFFHSSVLGLYASYPSIQIGPPALLANGVLQRLFSPSGVGYGGDVAVMAVALGLGVLSVWMLERLAMHYARPRWLAWAVGVPLVAVWARGMGRWGHFEDVIAVTCVIGVALAVAKGRHWSAALLLGLAVSCKPWAMIAVPMLLGLPRRDAARALGLAFIAATAPWLPFLLADGNTMLAFRGAWPLAADTPMHLLGIRFHWTPQWFREAQFLSAAAVGSLVALRRDWSAGLLAAVAVKVLLDPRTYSYYGMLPVAACAVVDIHRGSRVPWWTLSALVVDYLLPAVASDPVQALGRLVWGVAAVALLVRQTVASPGHSSADKAAVLLDHEFALGS